ncbi:hypothetical protein EV363DRAFT_1175611 [Boletus edulis]|nr:hypothetical protein EV363DRAFT_1175611 [Boletus edulis]
MWFGSSQLPRISSSEPFYAMPAFPSRHLPNRPQATLKAPHFLHSTGTMYRGTRKYSNLCQIMGRTVSAHALFLALHGQSADQKKP